MLLAQEPNATYPIVIGGKQIHLDQMKLLTYEQRQIVYARNKPLFYDRFFGLDGNAMYSEQIKECEKKLPQELLRGATIEKREPICCTTRYGRCIEKIACLPGVIGTATLACKSCNPLGVIIGCSITLGLEALAMLFTRFSPLCCHLSSEYTFGEDDESSSYFTDSDE